MRLALRSLAGTALAAAVLLAPAAAQVRPGGRSAWTPPFSPASPAMLSAVQSLLDTPAGLKLSAELPSLQAVRSYSPASEADLRVVGALSAHLPQDFEARMKAAAPDALASLAKTLGGAYQKAVPEVAQAVQARAQQVAVAVAYGRINGRELVAAADQLERFGLYGTAVQEKARIVRRLASQQIMEDAQRLASDFLSRQRPADDESARPGQGPAGTYGPGGPKKVPEAWKLRAYQKAAESGASARPAPPEPKANPMSRNLYERIGAARGMGPAQLEAAFRQAAELHRPERYLDRDTRSLIVLTMAYKRIEEAYETLRDPQKRAEYDRGALPQAPPAANPLAEDYYERIGATKGMTQDELKTAYRKAAAAYHPDKSRTKDEALVKAMTKAFQDIGEAYETLRDPQKRAAYDRKPAKEAPRR